MGMLGDADDGSEPDSDSEASASEKEEEQEDPEEQKQAPKKKKIELSVEDLERAGYKSGPSVLHVRAPAEQGPTDWNWSNGRAAKDQEEDDDEDDRAATREAVTRGLTESAQYAVKSMQYAAKLRDEAKEEKERLAKEKRLSFNQKEKRKRDTGQASRGKSYVEESKRQAREFGMYSGFD